ncbi:uncharacterized protein LOC110980357 isoform X2 [Acanthaster planci]|uniref:Uncharacterized protein LOC110980357 isoform X2 n=1 Tax=Acanthaster planci TaxID=133434 RepID=A0A8B7YHD1_ACAPL|nr:uncharacterized protein LOC110980357 isoform X2 [Acanthaster planci]
MEINVRICFRLLFTFLWLSQACVLLSTSAPLVAESQPELFVDDEDKQCQDDLGWNYVYDEGVATCVSCGSCECGHIANNPHCVKCQDGGILKCSSSPETVTSIPHLETTRFPPTTLTVLQTTWKSFMTSPLSANTTTSYSSMQTYVSIAIGVIGLGVILLAVVLCIFLYRRYRPKREHRALVTQDTERHEQHPMMPFSSVDNDAPDN